MNPFAWIGALFAGIDVAPPRPYYNDWDRQPPDPSPYEDPAKLRLRVMLDPSKAPPLRRPRKNRKAFRP